MRKSSLRKIREVIREYAENLGIRQNSVFFFKNRSSIEKFRRLKVDFFYEKSSHIGTILIHSVGQTL